MLESLIFPVFLGSGTLNKGEKMRLANVNVAVREGGGTINLNFDFILIESKLYVRPFGSL